MADIIGWWCLGIAAVVAAFNLYHSILRGYLYQWMGWPFKWVSGIPAIGTILVVVALILLGWSPWGWVVSALILALDTAGLPWFVGTMYWMPRHPRGNESRESPPLSDEESAAMADERFQDLDREESEG